MEAKCSGGMMGVGFTKSHLGFPGPPYGLPETCPGASGPPAHSEKTATLHAQNPLTPCAPLKLLPSGPSA